MDEHIQTLEAKLKEAVAEYRDAFHKLTNIGASLSALERQKLVAQLSKIKNEWADEMTRIDGEIHKYELELVDDPKD